MGSKAWLRGILLITASLLCPLLTGCVLGYAYPTIARVPAVSVVQEAQAGEIHAFRVDVADDQNCIDFPEQDCYVLRTVPLSPEGDVPPQTKVGLDYGWILNCVALVYSGHTHHTVLVRLYRPGWQTVEIKAWDQVGPITWKESIDLPARERAVDDLLSTWNTDALSQLPARTSGSKPPPPQARPWDPKVFRNLAPGSASAWHRQALLFAAAEYDRLAAAATADKAGQEQRQRVADKAKRLRELAAR
jgi:hypothetical protein